MAEYHKKDHEGRGEVAYGPNSVRKRAELAVWIAAIAAVWALIEWELVLIYGYLMGKSLPRVGMTKLPMLHPVALQVFEAVHGLNNRIDLLQRLAKREATDAERAEIKQLTEKVRAAAGDRNKIVHGLWGVCSSCPDDLILHGTTEDPRSRRYAEHDLVQIHKKLSDLQDDVYNLTLAIQRRLHRAPSRETKGESAPQSATK